jgi:hypothetical protein
MNEFNDLLGRPEKSRPVSSSGLDEFMLRPLTRAKLRLSESPLADTADIHPRGFLAGGIEPCRQPPLFGVEYDSRTDRQAPTITRTAAVWRVALIGDFDMAYHPARPISTFLALALSAAAPLPAASSVAAGECEKLQHHSVIRLRGNFATPSCARRLRPTRSSITRRAATIESNFVKTGSGSRSTSTRSPAASSARK